MRGMMKTVIFVLGILLFITGIFLIVSFLGTIFGPMFTVPWWFDKWFGRRKQGTKDSNQSSTSIIKQE